MRENRTTSDVNNSFIFPYRIGDEQKCITDTEKELRFLINTIMTNKFDASWMSNPTLFSAKDYGELIETQRREAKTLTNNPVLAAELLEYCYIHNLKEIIEKNWDKAGFVDIFPQLRGHERCSRFYQNFVTLRCMTRNSIPPSTTSLSGHSRRNTLDCGAMAARVQTTGQVLSMCVSFQTP